MSKFDLRKFSNPQQLAQAAAADWLQLVSSKSAQGIFSTALSGGRIAGVFFAAIVDEVKAAPFSLTAAHFFWSDERCVPPGDAESNFHLANDLLFKPLATPASRVHRIPGEKAPAEASMLAESELRAIVISVHEGQPVLDLVMLGMGEEGHVASLFPGEAEELVKSAAVFRTVKAVKPPPIRITMGYRAIAAAREVWVLASGIGKEAALRESLDTRGQTPLAHVLKLRTNTRIYCDIPVSN
jgi:6-phosphogluconolactonase